MFPSREAAEEWLKAHRPELQRFGRSALALSASQRADAEQALRILAEHGVTLTEAARAYHERTKLLKRSVTFQTLRDELIAAKRADGKSEKYLIDLRSRLTAFGRTFDARQAAAIEAREIDDWLRELGQSAVNRMNFRRVLHLTFEFARMRGYVAENAVAKTAKVKAETCSPGILTPEEVQALLNAADASLRPSLALSAFAGVRDAEIDRLNWDKVDLESGYLRIDSSIAKTASNRLIKMSENLKAWLAPYAQAEGRVRPDKGVRQLQQEAREKGAQALRDLGIKAGGLAKWPPNALRHSFASYRYAQVGEPATVAEECGHSVQVLKAHYRELVSREQAQRWFGVFPPASI